MNAASKAAQLRPETKQRRVADLLLGKAVTLVLAAIAIVLGIVTFVLLSGGMRLQLTPNALLAVALANLVVLLLLGAVLAGRVTRVWVERRRGSAGSRLHVRLVMLFSVVAVTPTILVALFATAFFTLGIQAWFNDRVRTALNEGLEASRGYLEEHRNNIRADALGMANDLSRAGSMLVSNPYAFGQVLQTQTVLRGLTEALIFEPVTGQVVAGIGAMEGLGVEPAPQSAIEQARSGEVAVLGSPDDNRVLAVVQLNSTPPLMLQIGRPVDQDILNHMVRTERAVAEYSRLDENRTKLQITFAMIFALVALLVLMAAVLIGLVLANQIARPIGGLIRAAERVRGGDLTVRVPETESDDEVAGLSRAFNRMTGQLASQRTELMDAYSQIDERRRFTETVLAGVSAGVIGLDADGRVELPNRVASELLARDLIRAIGADLAQLVPETESDDEVAGLSRAFNRMTGQLGSQRSELMDAYSQIDERRRFTETVLAGVSAGVIGLDVQGRVELPNRAASELLGTDLITAIGSPLGEVVPQFAPLLVSVAAQPERAHTAEIEIGPAQRRRTLLVRVGTDLRGGRPDGYVVTFDDITELQSAQRKAAWSDVARRIAHEIKNPLTPIQLSAERLKRRFAKEIKSDPDTFAQCADTIVRHVGDIGRMVDEFSAFARMPQPVLKPDDVGRVAREALILQRSARPEIEWVTDIPERGPIGSCDRRLLGQALTNLLQNAADSVAMRVHEGGGKIGRIEVVVHAQDNMVLIDVLDDGIGLPQADRARLTEPYVTHKPKGTGLGLAIVKKIMEDHGGRLELDDRAGGQGAVATLALPLIVPHPVPA